MKDSAVDKGNSNMRTRETNVAGPEPLNRFLRMAVMAGVESAVQIHIDRGDDLDARDGSGMTPLMLAAARNRASICKLLLDAGASNALLDPSGRTAHAIALAASAHEAAAILGIAQELRSPHQPDPDLDPLPIVRRSNFLDPIQMTPEEGKGPPPTKTLGSPLDSANITAAVSTMIDSDELSEFDLSEWEAEEESLPPEVDISVVKAADAIQLAISNHEPIDSSAEWDDIDAYLPEQALPLARVDDEETRTQIRTLLLRAIREGSVPGLDVADLAISADRLCNPEAERLLIRILNDLGAEVDERFEYATAFESFKVFVRPDETSSEEKIIDEALAAMDSAISPRNEPLRLYQREFQRLRLISANEEVELGKAMEGALAAALDALAAWPQGVQWTLTAGLKVKNGLRPLTWMSLGGVSDIEPSFADDVDASPALFDLEEGVPEDNDESPIEISPQLYEATFAEALDRLSILPISTNGHGPSWHAARDALAALRLTRDFLLVLADNDAAKTSEAGIRYARTMHSYKRARDAMMSANLRLVFHIAQKHQYCGEPLDDLTQEGNLGLLKAVERYDWRRGFKFSTYASWWIRQHIGRYIADKGRTIRVPVHVYAKLQRLQREMLTFDSIFGREPNPEEIAASMEMPAHKVAALYHIAPAPLPIHEVSVDDLIAVETSENLALQSPENRVYATELRRSIDDFLATLTRKEEQIIRMRYGIGTPDALTLEEVGQRYEVTRERVRQIETKALQKLSRPNRRDAFARTALGITKVSERSKAVVEGNSIPDAESTDQSEELGLRPPEVDFKSTPGNPNTRAGHSSRLGQLLARAAQLGVAIDDERDGQSGKIWVNLVGTSDKPKRLLARQLLKFGFKSWPGKGYWI